MPTKKQSSREAIASQEAEGKYSPEALRKNMSTGGGTPIPAGHKWTNEHRVLQPRDPDNGHFTYNADAKLGLKYKSHGKADATPIGARAFGLAPGAIIKKGDVVNIAGTTWTAIEDIDYEKVKEFYRRWDEGRGEYYSYGQLPSQATLKESFELISETVHDAKQFSDFFVKKQGRMSKGEKEGIEKGDTVVGKVDIDMVGDKTKAEISAKMDSLQKGFTPNLAEGVATKISPEKFDFNTKYNAMVDEKAKGDIGDIIKDTPVPPEDLKPEEPAKPEEKPEEPAKPEEKPSKPGEISAKDISYKLNHGGFDYYNNPQHKQALDTMAADIKRHPEKYHMTADSVKGVTGEKLAYLANHGSFKNIPFKLN